VKNEDATPLFCKEENQKKYGIQTIGIFGSASRDSFYNESDIDVVVEFENPDLFTLSSDPSLSAMLCNSQCH